MNKKHSVSITFDLLKKIEILEKEIDELILNEEHEKVAKKKVILKESKDMIEAFGAYSQVLKLINQRKEILSLLEEYLEEHPKIRITQAIMNLHIVQRKRNRILLNPFYDTDEDVLERINKRKSWFKKIKGDWLREEVND